MTNPVRNVLFIMADQLRWDHLGCAGHPWLKTPHLDALARRGVRFANAFVNSGVCGPSRMSYYTGRYPISHGATWNRVPLGVGERTLGEYMRDSGRRLALAGKTHVMPDDEGLRRLALDGGSELGRLLAAGGFEEVDRYDGHHEPGDESGYPAFLRAHGYDSADPWSDFVISGVDGEGRVVSGWQMRNVHLPARVREAHSETAFMTDQAMGFMRRMGDQPWVLHLSYVKPHWPYMAPAPYHAMYTADQCLPVVRSAAEREDEHPVLAAYRQSEESLSFQRDDCIRTVRPAYQGLISQLDAHLGRLFEFMDGQGLLEETLIVFTADHGDFLGDHWLGEKELFYDTVQKVPFVVVDPRPEADTTRGRVDERFVEAVDVVPTLLDALGLQVPSHRVEGRSLLPLLHGGPVDGWREAVYSELDYSFKAARRLLGKPPQEARAFSLRDARWRYVHWLGAPEQLFDLQADPQEFQDLGRDPGHAAVREAMRRQLLDFLARRKHRTTVSDAFVESRTDNHKKAGVFFGQW
ncbi:sulfatase-like hydrolase/transferase [Aquabacterium sp. J223]|uniref:sulfatase-like hydrolase/transferase n=1 Tax=Aquabacterium sp. J223 TaxID=2898431 RepID=UPI0021AE2C6A|nr:sulfatase-like hydrolase/transferase [Aquabacterium sp. J223]UUX94813.1 sulfatase-like hydrolase/transferase [Aquabacterium sp. J223]